MVRDGFSEGVELEPILKDGEELDKQAGQRDILSTDSHKNVSPLRTESLLSSLCLAPRKGSSIFGG